MSSAITPKPTRGKYYLRLYIAESTPQSLLASRNLQALCEKHLAGRYEIEVIDLMKNPERAQQDGVLVVPTLVRKVPSPIRKFIGSLSNPERVLIDFNLTPETPEVTAPESGASRE